MLGFYNAMSKYCHPNRPSLFLVLFASFLFPASKQASNQARVKSAKIQKRLFDRRQIQIPQDLQKKIERNRCFILEFPYPDTFNHHWYLHYTTYNL